MRFLNRGISGNRVKDLRARWQTDYIDLRLNAVSILIGINDTRRRYDKDDPTGADAYEESYRAILEDVRRLGAGIIILEPFVLPRPLDRLTWRVDLDPKIQVARHLAREFAALCVALVGLLAAARQGVAFMLRHTGDPVHGGWRARVRRDGTEADGKKWIYGHSFAI